MLDATPPNDPAPTAKVATGAPEIPPTAPAPGKPGSLPFTPYGGTTAPYRPKAATPVKTLSCKQCRASGFATSAELDAHNVAAHPAVDAATTDAVVPAATPPGAAGTAP